MNQMGQQALRGRRAKPLRVLARRSSAAFDRKNMNFISKEKP
jgi:hypothetical protein